MEQVERKLASLTGLVQTALTSAVGVHVQLSDNDLDSDTNNSGLPLRIPPAEPGIKDELYLLPFFFCFSLHFEMLLLSHLSSRPRQPKEFKLFFLDSRICFFLLLKEMNCVF